MTSAAAPFELFEAPEPVVAVDPYAGMGQDARRTATQVEKLTAGIHPATGSRLHVDAAPVADRSAPGLRCGTCAHRWEKHERSFTGWKCGLGGRGTWNDGPDLRLWWPACREYREGDAS